MKKKLSTVQAFVINALIEDKERFVKTSGFYNYQELTDGVKNGFHEYFTRPTLESLIKAGYLARDKDERKYHKYILNPKYKIKNI